MDLTKTPPLYIHIADALREQIESGRFVTGERLPSERELSHALHASRATVRQALTVLETQGLLTRKQGSGAFVCAPKIERRIGVLIGFWEDMRQQGYEPGAYLLFFETLPAPAGVSERLRQPAGVPVHYIHRLRLANAEPMTLERTYVLAERFPDLERYDLAGQSLYSVLESKYGVRLARAEHVYELVVATQYEASLLNVRVGTPLMLEQRVVFDQNNVVVEYAKDLYRSDRFRFVAHSPTGS